MKIRDSGMPDEPLWSSFFDPQSTLRRLGLVSGHGPVVDFGCGYGTFSIAAARITSGTVYALDIDPGMIAATAAKARSQSLGNVEPIERDFMSLGSGLPTSSMGYAMLFNILHAEDAKGLLNEAFRVLRVDGTLAMMHWVHDANTPRGPALEIRPRPEQCVKWASEVGFVVDPAVISLPPYHFGLVARKPKPD
jgi:ubiquinone/menaquinone biosynthesis C-methylase UbiE